LNEITELIKNYDVRLLKCKLSPFYFITKYCYTLAPQRKSKIELIPKWDYIELLIDNIHRDQNNLIEKSRQMTVSWISQAYNIWGLLFGNGYSALNLSRKEGLVDDSSHNSLFGKMRFIYKNLPEWMIEEQLGQYQPVDRLFKFLNVENKIRNNSIIGESANPDAGRSGNYKKVFADEFAFVNKSENVYSGFDEACPTGKNLISTPSWKGKKTCFYRLRQDALKQLNDYKIIRIHWIKHPERNKEWYKQACRGKTDDEIARELDIDWNVSVKGRILDRWNSNNHVVEYKYQKELPLDLDFDFGIGESPVSIGFSQDLPDNSLIYFKDLEYKKLSVAEIAPKLINELNDFLDLPTNLIYNFNKIENVNFDELERLRLEYLNKSGLKCIINQLRCFGDPSGKAKGATGKSWISEFEKWGFNIRYTFSPKLRDLEFGHLQLQRLVSQNKLLCTQDCTIIIDSLENYKRKTDSEGNVLDSQIVSDDWAKHRVDGIRYKVINTRCKEQFDERMLQQLPPGI